MLVRRSPSFLIARAPENFREGRRWNAPFSSKSAHDTSRRDKARECVTPDAKCAPLRGGHCDRPPSPLASQSWSGLWTQRWDVRSTRDKRTRMKNWGKQCYLLQYVLVLWLPGRNLFPQLARKSIGLTRSSFEMTKFRGRAVGKLFPD